MALPYEIGQVFRQQTGFIVPGEALRVFKTVGDTVGEGWLASWAGGIMHISRDPSAGLQKHRYPAKDIVSISIEETFPGAPSIIIVTGENSLSLPFSGMRANMTMAKRLCSRFRKATPPDLPVKGKSERAVDGPPPLPKTAGAARNPNLPPPLPKANVPPPLHGFKNFAHELEMVFSPHVVYFCAALLVGIRVERKYHIEQHQIIHRIFENPECITQAERLLEETPPSELWAVIRQNFNDGQKNCLLLNMLDVLTVDGDFTEKEQQFVKEFLQGTGMKAELWERCKSFIMAKNNYGVLEY
ncbi:MAG: hypothetical protein J5833_05585 [Victivallales bacterium]|nr:hypothetical protein [Victivallales bacterium]